MPSLSTNLHREFLKGLSVAIPIAILQALVIGLLKPFSENPWIMALVLLPLAAVLWFLGRPLYRDNRTLLGGGFLLFFIAYCAFFSLAAGTDLLSGRRTLLAGFEEELPRNWLGLNRLGDWHYGVAPHSPPAPDLILINLDTVGDTRTNLRHKFGTLINLAVKHRAQGIAFDFYFNPDKESPMDGILCRTIAESAAAGVPVLFGYRHTMVKGVVVRPPLPTTLQECLQEDNLGSLAGYLEADGKVRMVPLFLGGMEQMESISLKVARHLAGGKLSLPQTKLLRFTRPAPLNAENQEPLVVLKGMPSPEEAATLFQHRFVLVGSSRQGDVHNTPFGPLPGAMIHAFAAHSLRSGSYIRTLHHGWTFPAIFCLCFLMALIQARGQGPKVLLATAGILISSVLVMAAAAMRFGLIWVDVSYAVVAVGGMTFLLLGGAAVQNKRVKRERRLQGTGSVSPPAPGIDGIDEAVMQQTEPFDIFLSHNGSDKPLVKQLAETLQERNLRVWLDVWELTPGRPWQEALEDVIRTVRTAAVLVGPDGLGPWEVMEMRACLQQCVERDMPVIPVLLPGAEDKPDLPLFLKGMTWVDLRPSLSKEGIDRLEWGVTGVKPKQH